MLGRDIQLSRLEPPTSIRQSRLPRSSLVSNARSKAKPPQIDCSAIRVDRTILRPRVKSPPHPRRGKLRAHHETAQPTCDLPASPLLKGEHPARRWMRPSRQTGPAFPSRHHTSRRALRTSTARHCALLRFAVKQLFARTIFCGSPCEMTTHILSREQDVRRAGRHEITNGECTKPLSRSGKRT